MLDKIKLNVPVGNSLLARLAGILLLAQTASADTCGLPPEATKHWTADNGNGTYSNPLFYGEFEDPDVIRVGDDYYLAGTTMHMNPAVEILHSKDLVNWNLAGYCTNRLDLGPAYRLEGGSIYGDGIWAPCLRYHKGMFYILCNVNGSGLHIFRSKSITGPWEHNQLPYRHDLSVLFDDELGKVFTISGFHSPYPIEELSPDLRSFDTNAPKHFLVGQMGGGQSLNFGLKHLDTFAWVGGFSSAPNTKPPAELVPNPAVAREQLKLLYLSCGNKDGLISVSQGVHTYLKQQNVPHIWNVDDHGHDGATWGSNLYYFVQRLFITNKQK